MKVADLMQTDVTTIRPDAPVAEVIVSLAASDHRRVGVISTTDIVRAVATGKI